MQVMAVEELGAQRLVHGLTGGEKITTTLPSPRAATAGVSDSPAATAPRSTGICCAPRINAPSTGTRKTPSLVRKYGGNPLVHKNWVNVAGSSRVTWLATTRKPRSVGRCSTPAHW